jgi:predicted nucleic acid-binding protein
VADLVDTNVFVYAHAGMDAGLSFWDALVWATARANGVTVIHTEDFAHGRVVDGVGFLDPFRRA